MRRYGFTDIGEQIIAESGLEVLSQSIYEKGNPEDLTYSLFGYDLFGDVMRDGKRDTDEMLAMAYNLGRAAFGAAETEKSILRLGKNQWIHKSSDDDEGRLFPVPTHRSIADVDTVDVLVLGGAIGLEYKKRSAMRAFLSEESQRRFGFDSLQDAAAFAGAYIISSLDKQANKYRQEGFPEFTTMHGAEKSTIALGGDMHGDFRMFSSSMFTEGIVSPSCNSVEFAPTVERAASGYHSVEPALTFVMLRNVLDHEGYPGLRDFLGELYEVANNYIAETDGSMRPDTVLYGDYGMSGNIDSWSLLLNIDEVRSPRVIDSSRTLFSVQYLPQSHILFEIRSNPEDIAIYNRYKDNQYNPQTAIQIRRKDYAELFHTLLRQATSGTGRTSVHEHFQLIETAANYFNDRDGK